MIKSRPEKRDLKGLRESDRDKDSPILIDKKKKGGGKEEIIVLSGLIEGRSLLFEINRQPPREGRVPGEAASGGRKKEKE